MQGRLEQSHAVVPGSHVRPAVSSYGSGEEFSIYHWIEVRKLVDEGEFPLRDETPDSIGRIEEA
jgi:hypothetical protein